MTVVTSEKQEVSLYNFAKVSINLTQRLTAAQGALAYLLSIDPSIMPIPGAKLPAQIEENTAVLQYGMLPNYVFQQVNDLFTESRRDYNLLICET